MTGARSVLARSPWPRVVLALAGAGLSAWMLVVSTPFLGVGRAVLLQLPTWAFLIGGLVAWRARPTNPIGALMTLAGVLAGPSAGVWQGASPLGYTLGGMFGNSYLALAAHVIVAFPSGRLSGRRERRTMAFVYFLSFFLGPLAAIFPQHSEACGRCAHHLNELAIGGLRPYTSVYYGLMGLLPLLAIALVARILIRRWRGATPPARRVLAPVLLSGVVAVVTVASEYVMIAATGSLGPTSFAGAPPLAQAGVVFSQLTFAAVPLCFLAGLLRTRVTRSTLGELVTALTRPQHGDSLRRELARALGDDSLVVGFWVPDRGRFIAGDGRPVEPAEPDRATTEIEDERGPLAVLVHDPALGHDPGLVEAVAAAARLALQNGRLEAEVRAQLESVRESRARVAEAADAERRRIERVLQEGPRRLIGDLAAELHAVRGGLTDPAARGARLIQSAADEAETALRELDELARGLHPQILAEEGLGAALRSLAERSAVPAEVGASPQERLPEAVEGCAYFICSEALANVAKYARATRATVRAAVREDALEIEVADDGVGGAHLGAGSGLVGLRDRAEALGGTLDVASPPGQGTRVTARIPLTAPLALA